MMYKYFFIIFILFLVSCSDSSDQQKTPTVKNGVLDLREWNFEEDPFVPLNGDWNFFWEELLSPNQYADLDSSARSNYMQVPKSWNPYFNDLQLFHTISALRCSWWL